MMHPITLAWLQVGGGLALLVAGGELLVRGASRLAAVARISPLVIGLTVVAFGTSAPELAVSANAAWSGNTDLALGNVVGSNIFNVLFILGLSALLIPLVVSSQLVRRDVPLMILASLAVWWLGSDGWLSRGEGLGLLLALAAYTWWGVRQSRRESLAVQQEFAAEWPPRSRPGARGMAWLLALIGVGLCLLGVGSRWLVDGAAHIGRGLGVSEMVIGLTVVAVGTSLPEVVTSLIAAIRGERDIAVGNVVGSNLFNLLGVLGVACMIKGTPVSSAAMQADIPIMIGVAAACLPIFFTGHLISRWEGGLFLFYYLAYTAYLVLDAAGHESSRLLRDAMLVFVLPLTSIALAIGCWRALRSGPAQANSTRTGAEAAVEGRSE